MKPPALTFAFGSILTIRDQVEKFSRMETGGLLFGGWEERYDMPVVEYAAPCGNAAANPFEEFSIRPQQQADFAADFAAQGFDLLGSYHSHPNGNPDMSAADAAMATVTGFLLIVAPGVDWQWRLYDPESRGEASFAIAPPG